MATMSNDIIEDNRQKLVQSFPDAKLISKNKYSFKSVNDDIFVLWDLWSNDGFQMEAVHFKQFVQQLAVQMRKYKKEIVSLACIFLNFTLIKSMRFL